MYPAEGFCLSTFFALLRRSVSVKMRRFLGSGTNLAKFAGT